MRIAIFGCLLLSLLPSSARAAERELRILSGVGTRIANVAPGHISAAIFSERVEVGYSARDWLELSGSFGYVGLYSLPTEKTKSGTLTATTVSKAQLVELLVGPTLRVGMTTILSLSLKIGPQFGFYAPRYTVFSSDVHGTARDDRSLFLPALLGIAQAAVERRVGEHWAFGLQGSVEQSMWVRRNAVRVTSGSIEIVASYAFFPGS